MLFFRGYNTVWLAVNLVLLPVLPLTLLPTVAHTSTPSTRGGSLGGAHSAGHVYAGDGWGRTLQFEH